MRGIAALAAAMCLTASSNATALTLTTITDQRYVNAYVTVCEITGCVPSGASTEYASFGQDFDASVVDAQGWVGATQQSSISSTGIHGTGGVSLSIAPGYPFPGLAVSNVTVVFTIDEAALMSFTADLAFDLNLPYPAGSVQYFVPADVYAALWSAPAGGYLFEDRILSAEGTPESDSETIARTLLLAPGQYTFRVMAVGSQNYAGTDFGSASFGFDLDLAPVPEPGGLALLAVAALGCLRARAR